MNRAYSERHTYRLKAEAEVAAGFDGPRRCVCGVELSERTGQRAEWFCCGECRQSVIWRVVLALAGSLPPEAVSGL